MPELSIKSTFKLNSGYEMPVLGFGVYQTPPAETEKACLEALKVGYRHIDSAVLYRNEGDSGAAIRNSGIPRSEIFYTSKIPKVGMTYEQAVAQIDKSLAEANVGYIDLMLIHCPFNGSANRKGVWRALVEAVEAGKIRSIGISNYGIHHLDELEQHIKELEEERGGKGKGGVISVGQWEAHPWCVRADIAEWCAKRNIAFQAYSPLVQAKRMDDATLQKLAKKYGKTPAQILVRWSLQKGYVPLPKSVTPNRIKENIHVFDFDISKGDVDELTSDEYAPVCWDPVKWSLDVK